MLLQVAMTTLQYTGKGMGTRVPIYISGDETIGCRIVHACIDFATSKVEEMMVVLRLIILAFVLVLCYASPGKPDKL